MSITIDGNTVGNVTIDGESVSEITADGDIVFQATIEAAAGVITFFSDSEFNIPSGWVICDGNNGTPNLIGKYIHMTGPSEDPGSTGGSNNPSSAGHNHGGSSVPTTSGTSSDPLNMLYGSMQSTSMSIGAEHPHHKIIPIQATGSGSTFDSNITMGVNGSIPSNWSSTSFDSGLLKGNNSNDTTTSGSSTVSIQHSHDLPNYDRAGKTSDSGNNLGYLGDYTDSDINNQPAYVTLELISSNVSGADPTGLIGFWNDQLSNIPSGWLLCDGNNGTPNLAQDRMLRADTSTGSTGGSNTASFTSHNHLLGQYYRKAGSGSSTGVDYSGFWDSGNDSDSWSDIRKPYYKLAPIQKQ